LIAPYVLGASGEQSGFTTLTNTADFENSMATLMTHIASRQAAVATALQVR